MPARRRRWWHLYLLSNPHANMLGLYYLPQLYIAHETGLGIEGASNGLRMAIEAGFCDYDADSEVVFVYEMARFQIAERLEPPDKRCTGIQREYDALPNNLFLSNFYEKYVGAFHLKKPREGTSPFEGASKALRSQEQEQEQEQEDKTLLSDPSGSDESVFARQKPPCKTVTIAETSYLLSELETAVEDVFAHFVAVLKKSKLYSLDATRKRHGLARLKECLRAAKPPALENSMAAMKDCIEKLVASKFHNGANSEGAIRKPLYRLPELLLANNIAICEGEKDCDNVLRAFGEKAKSQHLGVTTNFDGAGKWRDEYAVFFAGKRVVIFPDQDEIGQKHAQRVAESVSTYAVGVRIVNLPGLQEHGDVSDYLENHSADELIAEIKKTPQWRPAERTQKLFVPAPAFVSTTPEEINWLVEGIIERGANGFFSAVPKGGKSWAAVDLAICLALGCPWLGFRIPWPTRVALISREDNPALTAWRIKHLFAGKSSAAPGLLETNLYVNSRRESAELMLDNPEQMAELLDALKLLRPQFAIFDVFNVLHCADENDAQEMRTILRQLSTIQAEIGCGIGVVHHWNKADQGSMTQRLRGSSAIAGWAEWLIGFSIADQDTKTRRMEFELKAAQPPDAIHYRIESTEVSAKLSRVEAPRVHRREGSTAERYMQ